MGLLENAVRNYTEEHDRNNPDHAWILTPMNDWAANPHYRGPAVAAPEILGLDDPSELGDVIVVHDHDIPLLPYLYADGGHLFVGDDVHIYPLFQLGMYWVTTALQNALDSITLPMLLDDFGNLVDLP